MLLRPLLCEAKYFVLGPPAKDKGAGATPGVTCSRRSTSAGRPVSPRQARLHRSRATFLAPAHPAGRPTYHPNRRSSVWMIGWEREKAILSPGGGAHRRLDIDCAERPPGDGGAAVPPAEKAGESSSFPQGPWPRGPMVGGFPALSDVEPWAFAYSETGPPTGD